MTPAKQYDNEIQQSNTERLAQLLNEVEAAGVINQVKEIFLISTSPCNAYAERLINKND